MKPNLILGFCANYTFDKVEPFLSSFQNSEISQCELVLFVMNMTEAFELFCHRRAIHTYDATAHIKPKYHLQNGRFFLYKDYLKETFSKYNRVLVTDIRDVLIQGDPFKIQLDGEVSFALEDGLIRPCPYNSRWLKEIYGEEIFEELADKPISCSGTTIGTAEAMYEYITDMCEEISCREYDHTKPNDQGMHNYIVWKKSPVYGRIDYDDMIVNTVGLTKNERIGVEGGLVFVDRRFSPIIHQWDRHQILRELVDKHTKFKIF